MGALDNQYWNNLFEGRSNKVKGGGYTPGITGGSNDYANIQKQNQAVLIWVPKVRSKLIGSARWFSDGKTEPMVIRGNGNKRHNEYKLAASIRSKTRENLGEIDTITFSFERHGVFVHKGVSRGYPIRGGGSIKNPSGKSRVAIEWFNPVLDKDFPELANRIAEINADAVLNTGRAMIK